MTEETKPRMGLVPLIGLKRAAQVLDKGNQKEGRKVGDWKGKTRAQFVEARLRHIVDLDAGDQGEDHEGAILANSLIIAWFDAQDPKTPSTSFDSLGKDPGT